MKLFEIGNGLKSIKVPSKYFSEWEDDGIVVLYTDDDNDPEIRISVLSIELKEESDAKNVFDKVISSGEENGYRVVIEDDKSYFKYVKESEENASITTVYEIGYEYSYILISVTALIEDKDSQSLINTLQDVEQIIPTIKEISLEESNLFEPKYSDFKNINERISQVLNIAEEEINILHEEGKTLSILQLMVDEKVFDADHTYELQSLGIALGDYIQYKYDGFHWAIVCDEYGRDLALQYQEYLITVFPMTMISKRVEDGEKISLEYLVETLYQRIEEIANSGEYSKVDYNF